MESEIEFRTLAELNARLDHVRQAPTDGGALVQIVRRPVVGERELLEEAELKAATGLVGDRWAQSCSRRLESGELNPDSQITIMGVRVLELLTDDRDRWPLAGDNLLVDLDLRAGNLPAGQRLRIGTVLLEITAHPHLGCAKFRQRFGADALKFVNSPAGHELRLRGVHGRVIEAGRLRVGDRIEKR
ncbi:MAG TPA: MOSC domain-containing protein [Verrucomicrobiales bacterium]|nr:MOSC domain-containing protein [Verrucomicrobiales bacterium]